VAQNNGLSKAFSVLTRPGSATKKMLDSNLEWSINASPALQQNAPVLPLFFFLESEGELSSKKLREPTAKVNPTSSRN
jgi:hypothetical protein